MKTPGIVGRRRRSVAALLAVVLLLAACTSDGGDHDAEGQPPVVPTYAAATCPPEVSAVIIDKVACGFVTVAESPGVSGRTIKLFVVKVTPSAGVKHPDPLVVVGSDMAQVPIYSALALSADQLGREVLIVDPRGVGHSTPSLACGEVDALGPASLAVATDDVAMRARFLRAVSACHDRLAGQGVDLAAYNVTNMAADLVSLRTALHITRWNLATYGTAAPVAFELLRNDSAHIRAAYFDSPVLPGQDLRASAAEATRSALGKVLDACTADSSCHRRFPMDLAGVDGLLATYARHPVVRTYGAAVTGGHKVTIRYDDALVVRFLQYLTASNAGHSPEVSPAGVPAFLSEAADGDLAQGASHIPYELLDDQPYCDGYLPPFCLPGHVALGVYFSELCHDLAPFTDIEKVRAETGTRPGWATAFGHSPYLDVCTHWPEQQRARPLPAVSSSDTPVLMFVGGWDPYVNPSQLRARLTGLHRLTFVVVPDGSRIVLGQFRCAQSIRDVWVARPTDRPDERCLNDIQVTFTTSS